MKRWFPRQVLIAISSWFALTSLAASAQPVAWVTSSLQRTGQTDPAGSGTQAQLSAGKGEYESFQIVVRGPATGLSNVNVIVSDLTGPGGATIPKTSFTLYREHYVYVSTSSPNWGGSNQPLGAGWYPDGLIPFTDPATGASLSGSGAALVAVPFNLNANTNQPIWVDLLVPRAAVAGQYSGTFTVTSNQGNTSGTISLTVWNFTLPLKSTLRSTFLYWNTGNLAADAELLRNKIEPLREAVSEQSTLMSGFGLRDVALQFWSGADLSNCTMSAAPSVSQIQAAAAAQQPGLSPYIYSADEIGACSLLFPILQQWGYNMHQAGVNNLVTMAPTLALFSDGSGTGRSAVDIWTMLPVTYDGATSLVAQALAKGDSAWSYNTVVQDGYSPKWEIDFAPVNFRIQPGFISQSLGLTGMLYWKVDGWNATDPWNQVNNTGVFSTGNYPGEGQLVYPGTQVGISGVAPSMRLKWLRDGVQDYEYVALLKAAGQGSQALALAQSVGPNWTSWTRDPNQLASVRQQLGQLLDQLNGGTTVPPKPVNPSPASGATGVSLNPVLSWGAATGATSYDVYFGTTSTSLVATVTGTTYTPSTLAASTTYVWGVVAKNSAGTNSSAAWTFTTGAAAPPPPAAPANPNPASGATGVSSSPTLGWSASANATSYDVYFGTSSSPAFVTSTTGTTYTPGALASSSAYSWKVVAKNNSGTASSAVWTFTTSAPPPVAPTAVSATPTSGTGSSETLTLSYADGNGFADIAGAGAMINATFNGVNACWFYYDRSSNILSLASDSTSTWTALPQRGTVQNSQCRISSVTVRGSGNTFSLTVAINYTNTFVGTRNIYGYVQNKAGLSSGYQPLGSWKVTSQ
jgi:hypothetical protein